MDCLESDLRVRERLTVRMLDACALNPPILPAIADPIRFFFVLRLTRSPTVVLSTLLTIAPEMTASATTDLPRPSIQLIAAGFLSVQ